MYNRNFDMSAFLENITKAAQDFERNFREGGFYGEGAPGGAGENSGEGKNANEYGASSYPQANIYKTADGSLVFEFGLPGFSEQEIDLSFQGDAMVLSARKTRPADVPEDARPDAAEAVCLRRDITFKPVENRKFPVPADEYGQESVKAVFKNGLLTVSIPAKPAAEPKNKVPIESA